MPITALEVVQINPRKRLIIAADRAGQHCVLEILDNHIPSKGSTIKLDSDDLITGAHLNIHTQQIGRPVAAKVTTTGLSRAKAMAILGQGITIHKWQG